MKIGRVGAATKEQWENLQVRGNLWVRKDSEVPILQHAMGKVSHDRFSLNMEVAKHLVTVPSAKEANDITVIVRAKQSHGACGTERAGMNIGRKETQRRSKDGGRSSKGGGDVSRGDKVRTGAMAKGSEGSVGW